MSISTTTRTPTHRHQLMPSNLHRSAKPDVHLHAGSSHHRHRGRSSRQGTRRVVAVAVLVVGTVHLGLLVFFHLSLLQFLQEDFYATVAHQYPWILSTDPNCYNNSSETYNETADANSSVGVATLPPPPWPAKRDGCSAEDGTRPYCRFHNLLIDFSRVGSVAIGGEPLFALGDNRSSSRVAMGQSEMDEYLTYQPGAFRILAEPKRLPIVKYNSPVSFHYVNDVLSSLQVINVPNVSGVTIKDQNCTSYYYGTTLFLQRYEYVNLYHTLTDWWNTWTVYRHVHEGDLAHFSIVFLDAHPEGNLDPVWSTLFGRSIHLRKLDDDNIYPRQQERMCFQRALFVPPGYISHLWPLDPPNGGVGDNRTYGMMNSFVDFVLEKFRLSHVKKVPGRVVIIDRKPYVAHPRSRTVEDRSLSNLADVATKLIDKVPNVTSVRIVPLHNMTFREQVEAIREAEVLVGNHGAGLSHLVFMDDNSHVIEFQMNYLTFFNHLSDCKQGRLTLHQLPDVRGSISDAFFGNVLLPEFFNIYGIESQTEPVPMGDRPQVLMDAPILSDAIHPVNLEDSQHLEGAGEANEGETKKPRKQKVVPTHEKPNETRGEKKQLPRLAPSRLRDTLDSLVASKQGQGQQNMTASNRNESARERAANFTGNRTSNVQSLSDPHNKTSNHRNSPPAQRNGYQSLDQKNRTKDGMAFVNHRTKDSSHGVDRNQTVTAKHSRVESVKGNSNASRVDHHPSRSTANGALVSQIQLQGTQNGTNYANASESMHVDSLNFFVNGSIRVGKASPLREVVALETERKANDTIPLNDAVNVQHVSSVAHQSLNRTGNGAQSSPGLDVANAHAGTERKHQIAKNETIELPPSSAGLFSHQNGISKAANASPTTRVKLAS